MERTLKGVVRKEGTEGRAGIDEAEQLEWTVEVKQVDLQAGIETRVDYERGSQRIIEGFLVGCVRCPLVLESELVKWMKHRGWVV